MYQNEIEILNDLLKINPTDKIGERLISEWGSITNLALNLDAVNLTNRQRSVLSAALNVRLIREEKPSYNSPSDIAATLKDL